MKTRERRWKRRRSSGQVHPWLRVGLFAFLFVAFFLLLGTPVQQPDPSSTSEVVETTTVRRGPEGVETTTVRESTTKPPDPPSFLERVETRGLWTAIRLIVAAFGAFIVLALVHRAFVGRFTIKLGPMDFADAPVSGEVLGQALQQTAAAATAQELLAAETRGRPHREPTRGSGFDGDGAADGQEPVERVQVDGIVHLATQVTERLFRLVDPAPLGGVASVQEAGRILHHRGVLPDGLEQTLLDLIDLSDRAEAGEKVPASLQYAVRATGPVILQQLDALYRMRFVSFEERVLNEVEAVARRHDYLLEPDVEFACGKAADVRVADRGRDVIVECRARIGCLDIRDCKSALAETKDWLDCMPAAISILLVVATVEPVEREIRELCQSRPGLSVLAWDRSHDSLDHRIRSLLRDAASASDFIVHRDRSAAEESPLPRVEGLVEAPRS